MTTTHRGRSAPTLPLPFPGSTREAFVGAYPWNAPRPAIVPEERQLTREEWTQGQAVLAKINQQPHFLREICLSRYAYLKKNKGMLSANRFLTNSFMQRMWPRIEAINSRHAMNRHASERFLSESDGYQTLPGMNDKALGRLAARISGQIFSAYEELSDAMKVEHGGQPDALFTDAAQAELFGHVASMARAFNITPLFWKNYRKGTLNIRKAIASVSRLINEEWWVRQLKAQRTRWREALMIAVGQVSKKASPYASKMAIRDVQARRLANMDYLKNCELENVATGERIDLIDKVMASISNPEIRRMELMSTIAGIERYASEQRDVGMFITITTPSKYHPTRVIGKEENETVQFNRSWDKEAFTPKDGQRYLVNIWSKMRTAFKDADLKVYGMRVVEPHHDGTPHWHMMLFCKRAHRQAVIDIMRRYALKEDGDERGAAKYRFECKHLNKGGAAGYIAKYIAKNIDGYALDGQLDSETGKPLRDMAAAVTAWASTWRIPQFKAIGIPTMGAYRECRSSPLRTVNLTDQFDEQVEAVRCAADAGDFAAYMAAQGGANVSRELQTVRVARRVSDKLNEYDEEVQKVIGIFAPHLGAGHVFETRTTEWRIVSKAVDLEPLTLKSAPGAPRSPVNNCGLGSQRLGANIKTQAENSGIATTSETDNPPIDWNDDAAVRALGMRLREQSVRKNHKQRDFNPNTLRDPSPSARLTGEERDRIPRIQRDLMQRGISVQRWELEALARGAKMKVDGELISYPAADEWPGFSNQMEISHD
ncbi:replication protein [Pectobacterium brasiliense]|uniref:replication endonuclease n=1 Tax=Pectobacterium brasiliense TaxID=180957 RepID=UPI0004E6E597|nr:replication endonuclease [Pectobacterium brasiliense]KFF70315.1 replication protein [Pectobacterium brasiliense]